MLRRVLHASHYILFINCLYAKTSLASDKKFLGASTRYISLIIGIDKKL